MAAGRVRRMIDPDTWSARYYSILLDTSQGPLEKPKDVPIKHTPLSAISPRLFLTYRRRRRGIAPNVLRTSMFAGRYLWWKKSEPSSHMCRKNTGFRLMPPCHSVTSVFTRTQVLPATLELPIILTPVMHGVPKGGYSPSPISLLGTRRLLYNVRLNSVIKHKNYPATFTM